MRFHSHFRSYLRLSLAASFLFGSLPALGQEIIPFPTPRPLDAPQARVEANPAPSKKQTSHQQARRVTLAPATSTAPLKAFFQAYGQRRGPAALAAAKRLTNPLDRAIADWMIATGSKRGFYITTLRQYSAKVKNWPGGAAMRIAQENALVKAGRVDASVARLMPSKPVTNDGKVLRVRALLAAGRRSEAQTYLRKIWIEDTLDAKTEAALLRHAGGLLSGNDHAQRADALLYRDRASGALRLAKYVGPSTRALINARVAVIRRQKNAGALLKAVPTDAKRLPGYSFARIQHLRRADKWIEAGNVLAKAPRTAASSRADRAWWTERRMVSRKVWEAGRPTLAYRLAANHGLTRRASRIDAEFHAGWFALRFLKKPDIALQHFGAIAQLSKRPLSLSRAYYWAGRANAERGAQDRARANFKAAARLSHTYYGQLALQKLGGAKLTLAPLPDPSSARAKFDTYLLVQVIKRLNAVGQKGRTGIFYRHLAQTLRSPAEIRLLAAMAERNASFDIGLQVGKLAFGNGVNVPRLAFPLGAIPRAAGISRNDLALAYAIARQESAFDIAARSSADARGLMQLLPTTAKRVARQIGVPFDAARLTRDGAYNARLGSTFLKSLIKRFGGSYTLAIAGYNAGPRRSDQWIQRFGDPRKNNIDAIDWIEAIPFYETRNYVQRVMENYQIYRHRLDNAPLTLRKDIARGIPNS